jgi:hypothetical protein
VALASGKWVDPAFQQIVRSFLKRTAVIYTWSHPPETNDPPMNIHLRHLVQAFALTFFLLGSRAFGDLTFSPAGGTYSGPVSVTITDSDGGTVWYSVIDDTPGMMSSYIIIEFNGNPITLFPPDTRTIYAYSSGGGSASVTYSFNLMPPTCDSVTADPPSGTTNPPPISLSTTTSGASIYYTLDGSTPSPTNGDLYTGPIGFMYPMMVQNECFITISAIAVENGYADSPVSVFSYPVDAGPIYGGPISAPSE